MNVCDSAPFDDITAVYNDGPNDVVEPPVVRSGAAGECLDVAIQHGPVEGQRQWQDVFIGFVPMANSASFIAAMRESSRSATSIAFLSDCRSVQIPPCFPKILKWNISSGSGKPPRSCGCYKSLIRNIHTTGISSKLRAVLPGSHCSGSERLNTLPNS